MLHDTGLGALVGGGGLLIFGGMTAASVYVCLLLSLRKMSGSPMFDLGAQYAPRHCHTYTFNVSNMERRPFRRFLGEV